MHKNQNLFPKEKQEREREREGGTEGTAVSGGDELGGGRLFSGRR
jgi:hypothetical protein